EGAYWRAVTSTKFRDGVAFVDRDPDVGSVEGQVKRIGPTNWERAYKASVIKLADRIVMPICDPEVGAVKEDALRILPYWEGAHGCAVTGAQLGHVVAVLVYHPNVSAIKGYSRWSVSNGVGAHSGAGGGKQFGDRSARVVRNPDVSTVESYGSWVAPHGKILTIPLLKCRFERVQRRPASATTSGSCGNC